MVEQSNKPDSIFWSALGIAAPEERDRYLNQACADDPKLRAQLDELLAAYPKVERFLEQPVYAADATANHEPPIAERPGTVIGPYKLLEQIGEGGFGVVFMAEQTDPIQRKVALKIIKPGMDTRQVIARFEAERQALALMDHPNIARVLDAGATDTGRPYFVMELVRGMPVTDYCDQHKLGIRQRLELFVDVCQAVQHAHQKGIIHRDIKPTNVLVTLHDGRPVVKVIDFGVAKATGQKLTEKTLFTGFAQMVGTPLYMSPEQAELSGLDVDTRSDIYSLGVLLYELLTGTTPFHSERLKTATFDELRRIIREEEPPRPSTRLSTLAQQAISTVSQHRNCDPRQLSRLYQGELDWIVMKSLEKDRNRRYETANALATDVECYLGDEPVQACPPSAVYRFRKFARRNRGPLLAVTLVLIALLCGAAASTWQAIRAYHAEHQAKISEQSALHNAKRADEVSNFLVSTFRSPDPEKDAREITVAQVLDRSAKELQEKFADDPGTKADLLDAIGRSYYGLGLYREAIPLFEKERELRVTSLGPNDAQTLDAMGLLAAAYRAAGRVADALPLLEQELELRKAKLGPDDRDTLGSMNNLAAAYRDAGRFDDAVSLSEHTFKLDKAKLGPDDAQTLQSMGNLATAYKSAGRIGEAIPLREEMLKLTKAKLGPNHLDTLAAMLNLAGDYYEAGSNEKALEISEEVTPLMKAKLGPDHPTTLLSMANLAGDLHQAGRFSEALSLLEETVKLQKVKLGPDHPTTLHSMTNLGFLLNETGRTDEALPLLEEAFKLQKTKSGPDHPETLQSMNNLAMAYRSAGRTDEALKLDEETLKLRKAKLGPDHPETLESMDNLADDYRAAGRLDEALPLLEEAFKLQKTKSGPDHPETLQSMNNLAMAYRSAGRTDEALKLDEETLKLRKAKLGPDHRETLESMDNLADDYRAAGRLDEALKLDEETLKISNAKLGPDDPDTLQSMYKLAVTYDSAGRTDEALKLYEETLKLSKAKLGPDHPGTLSTMDGLGALYFNTGMTDEAVKLFEETLKLRTAKLGPDHCDTLASIDNLVQAYLEAGRIDEAINLDEETLKLRITKLGPDHPSTQNSIFYLDSLLTQPGVQCSPARYSTAVTTCREVILLRPKNGILHRSLAFALLKEAEAAGNTPPWDEATAELVQALDLSQNSDRDRRIDVGFDLGQWDEVFNRVAQLRPNEPALWTGRGRYRVTHSRWKEAAADYVKGIHERPVANDAAEYAYLLVLLDDMQSYQEFCREIVARAGEPRDDRLAFVLARACGATPDNAIDPARLVQWATKGVGPGNSQVAASLHTLGLAYYRAGQYDLAITYLQKSNTMFWYTNGVGKAQNWLVLAMAQQRLGHGEEAKQFLETARHLIAQSQPKKPDERVEMEPQDWLPTQVFLREAEAMLNPSAPEIKALPDLKPETQRREPSAPNTDAQPSIKSPQEEQ